MGHMTCYTKWVLWQVILNGSYGLSYKMGHMACYTKWILWQVILYGSYEKLFVLIVDYYLWHHLGGVHYLTPSRGWS